MYIIRILLNCITTNLKLVVMWKSKNPSKEICFHSDDTTSFSESLSRAWNLSFIHTHKQCKKDQRWFTRNCQIPLHFKDKSFKLWQQNPSVATLNNCLKQLQVLLAIGKDNMESFFKDLISHLLQSATAYSSDYKAEEMRKLFW